MIRLRCLQLASIFVAAAIAASAEGGRRDPVFSQVSFDQWRAEGKQSLLHSSFDLTPPELSPFQRMITAVAIELDGPELADHHSVVLIEFEDSQGVVWQTHGSLHRQPEYLQKAFILPGDYTVAVALFDPVTQKHGFAQKKLHVPALKKEPLPGSWDVLPAVEFLAEETELPDAWYMPSVTAKLRLPVENHRPVRVDVLVNTTASDRITDSVGELRRNMNAVIPALKVISQIDLNGGTINTAFLDLVRRREVPVSSWADMREFLTQTNPGIVDVHALDSRWTMRRFFLDQVAKRSNGDPVRVLIILSGPAFLHDQEPVTVLDLPSDPDHRIFYVRCRLIPHSVLVPRPRPRPGARPQPPRFGFFQLPLDDLEQPLDASSAMVFDVITPEQFRRVLASIIGQISRL